jgi:hypothetical protein
MHAPRSTARVFPFARFLLPALAGLLVAAACSNTSSMLEPAGAAFAAPGSEVMFNPQPDPPLERHRFLINIPVDSAVWRGAYVQGARGVDSFVVRNLAAPVRRGESLHSPWPSEYAVRPSMSYRCSVLITSYPASCSARSSASTSVEVGDVAGGAAEAAAPVVGAERLRQPAGVHLHAAVGDHPEVPSLRRRPLQAVAEHVRVALPLGPVQEHVDAHQLLLRRPRRRPLHGDPAGAVVHRRELAGALAEPLDHRVVNASVPTSRLLSRGR